MLVATTTDSLVLVDPAVLKKAPSSISSCLDLLETPTASSWAPDNACLFIASENTIQKYEPTSNTLRNVYLHEEKITHMITKTVNCVIFSAANEIHVLEGSHITQTFTSHKGPVNSLSLSNDSSLLASTSPGAVHVHNLALGSHSVMRGLAGIEDSTSTFDLHLRGRLLVASGRQLTVFDTTRPSGPTKTVILNESATGDVLPVACSPFSKSLAAVATSGGFVGLVDLEKEKALIRTLNIKAPLTTIAFSPEGTAIFLGTQTGKILVVDLRSLDKPPKAVVVSEIGNAVQTISIQKKTKSAIMKTHTDTKKVVADPVPVRRTAPAKSPARKPATPSSPVTRRVTSATSPTKRAADPKKVLSPLRDPHGNAVRKAPAKLSATPTKVAVEAENPRRARTIPTTTGPPARKNSVSVLSAPRTSPPRRPRAGSSASRVSAKEPPSTFVSVSSSRASSSASRAGSRATQHTRTPSPGLPDVRTDPVTPVPEHKQRNSAVGVLGLGTPDVDRWVRAGAEDTREKGKGKTVGFCDDDEADANPATTERQRVLSMQISPRRPVASTSASTESWNGSPALDGSLSANGGASGSPAGVGGGPAHELLRTIVQDVMYDFQRETKADMMGLHLDLLRMGRGWKTELRTLMDEYVGDLRDLREENQRLRLENERLRRGAY